MTPSREALGMAPSSPVSPWPDYGKVPGDIDLVRNSGLLSVPTLLVADFHLRTVDSTLETLHRLAPLESSMSPGLGAPGAMGGILSGSIGFTNPEAYQRIEGSPTEITLPQASPVWPNVPAGGQYQRAYYWYPPLPKR